MNDIRNIGIGVYTIIANKKFIEHRDAAVIRTEADEGLWNPSKGPSYYRRWDYEAPEYSLESIGHKPSGQIPYDTLHPDMGKCDFKYYAQNGARIKHYAKTQMEKGNVDTIVLWKWVIYIRREREEEYLYPSISEGEKRKFEILGNFEVSEVLANLTEDGVDKNGNKKYRFKPKKRLRGNNGRSS